MTAYNSTTITTNGLGTRTVASLSRGSGSNGQHFRWNTSVAQSPPFTIVAVVKQNNTTSGFQSAAVGSLDLFLGADGSERLWIYGNSWGQWEGTSDILDNAWHVLQGDFNESATQGFVDNTLEGSLDDPDFGDTDLTALAIGSSDFEGNTYGFSAHNWNGDIAEVIFYNRLLTAGERAELEAYAAEYYGL